MKRSRGRMLAASALVLLVVVMFTACRAQPRYTSLDIDLLPCEYGIDNPDFFAAVEFREDGTYTYPGQLDDVQQRIEDGTRRITDLIIFTHGWNKSPKSAESDYREFLCRLHTELLGYPEVGESKRRGGLLVIGVFWPSTITNRDEEPYLVKPVSYYKIRNRADHIAEQGLSHLFESLGESMRTASPVAFINPGSGDAPRLHLLGHSFGGRMTMRAMEQLNGETDQSGNSKLVTFLTSAELLNVVLLNAAMPSERFEWIDEAIARARAIQRETGVVVPARFTTSTRSYLFNTHTRHDSANRVLFPMASLFNDDSSECAVGACGIKRYPTLCVSDAGVVEQMKAADEPDRTASPDILVWNADTENIVFAHSDIYKGRVARLVGALLYDDTLRCQLNPGCGGQLEQVDICPKADAS